MCRIGAPALILVPNLTLPYQSLAGSDDGADEIQEEIYEAWYQSEKADFTTKNLFLEFLSELKLSDPEEYRE